MHVVKMRPRTDDCLESWTKLMAGVELLPKKETERARLWTHLGKFIVAVRINTCREVKGEGLGKQGLEITWP